MRCSRSWNLPPAHCFEDMTRVLDEDEQATLKHLLAKMVHAPVSDE